MAAVFSMQPLGQILASIVGLAVLMTVGRNLKTETDHEKAAIIVDRIWRWVIGVGAIPALIAIVFRLTIPESPRYTLDVEGDGDRAWRDAQRYYDTQKKKQSVQHNAGVVSGPSGTTSTVSVLRDQDPERQSSGSSDDPLRPEWKIFFIDQGNIIYLLGTSLCWFLLDFAFFGLGINNPRVIAQIWASEPITNTTAANHTPVWGNPSQPDLSIYDVLKQDGVRSIITVSIGSLLGSIIIIKVIDFVPRKAWLAWSFVGMGTLFGIVGGSYFAVANTDMHGLTITLYVFSQLLFNLGLFKNACSAHTLTLPRTEYSDLYHTS